MENYLIRKLSAVLQVNEEDCRAIEQLTHNVRQFERGQDIIGEGEQPDCLHLMIEGWSARYKSLANGDRQIVGFLIPGDFCDLHVQILGSMDHAIVAMDDCRVAFIPTEEFEKLTSRGTRITRALWWTTLVDEAVLREWVVNVGRREAYEAAAHLMCEMHLRMTHIGLVKVGGEFSLPLTQEELADALGVSTVHVNRVLQKLRETGLIRFHGKLLTIHDVQGLREAAGFNADYLHVKPQQVAVS